MTPLPGAAARLASQRGVLLVDKKPRLTPSFQIDGVIVPSYGPRRRRPLAELVDGEKVTTVHSEAEDGRARRLGMWMSGEVIAAQHLLLQMGAAAVHSIVLSRPDEAIEAALRRHASFELAEAGPDVRTSQAVRRPVTPAQPEEGTPAAVDSRGQGRQMTADRDGHQLRSSAVRADAAREFIPGNYCRLCGYPFAATRRRTRCEYPTACQRRQQLPLQLRGYGCPREDRVHPEWRDLHS